MLNQSIQQHRSKPLIGLSCFRVSLRFPAFPDRQKQQTGAEDFFQHDRFPPIYRQLFTSKPQPTLGPTGLKSIWRVTDTDYCLSCNKFHPYKAQQFT